MGWESRKGKGRYYTRTVREGTCSRREYVGTGPLAEQAAALDDYIREYRREAIAARRQRVAHWRDAERTVLGYLARSLLTLRAWAVVHRRAFRVRIPRRHTMPEPIDPAVSVADLTSLLERIDAGDMEAQRLLVEWVESSPGPWAESVPWEEHTIGALVELAAGPHSRQREHIRQRVEQLKLDLDWEFADSVQRLLIGRVAVSWLYLTALDQLLAQALARDPVEAKSLEPLRNRAEKAHAQAVQLLQRSPIGRRRRPR